MNHPTPDEEMEALLAKLTPAPPDAALMARLKSAEPQQASNVIRLARWPVLAAAAGIAIALFFSSRRPASHPLAQQSPPPVSSPSSTAPVVKIPLESRQHLMEVQDLGVVQDASQQPVRLIRTTWLDEIYYETVPGGEPFKEARVRQEVMPVALQTY